MPLLRARYQVMQSTGPEDNVENNIVSTDTFLDLDPAETALVMIDVWGGHPIKSHHERTSQIMATTLRDAIDVARAARITCIYAPSPRVAPAYPQWVRYASDRELNPSPEPETDWPPSEYREKAGKYASLKKRPGELPESYPGPYPDWWHVRDIASVIAPQPGDFVVANGDQLHRLLRDRRIVHLFYAGFATNICLLNRDYGLHAMRGRNYAPIVLRDCTTAIETRDTIDGLRLTQAILADLERWYFTSDSIAFREAFGA